MKIIQVAIFKLTASLILIFSFLAASGDPTRELQRGDSLFKSKQYTQSLEVYQALYAQQLYSPAMMLKMAYIEEGLGHLAQTELYLNRYYLATFDPLAQNKMEDLANKNRLEGYQNNDRLRIFSLAAEFYTPLLAAIASACVFLLALAAFLKFKRQTKPVYVVCLLLGFLALLGTHAWLSPTPRQAILAGTTYLMEGPSAGSKVIAIVGEGHRVRVLNHQDVWVRVEWGERIVFVKNGELIGI